MIDNRIEKLEIDFPETALKLRNQVNSLQFAEYTNTEINTLVFSEDDALEQAGEIESDSLMWEKVRDLQHDIVDMFSKTTEIQERCESIRDDVFSMLTDLNESEFMEKDIAKFKKDRADWYTWRRDINKSTKQIVDEFFKVCD